MEYRGFTITVRQTLSRGFRWSVNYAEGEKAGIASDRGTAVRQAKLHIDAWLRRRGQPKPRDQEL